ncbi:ferrous iron transport protein B [Lyticum sinuosum]|uniref:Ferrous iron transport protein B n=1 Tax=Lyticum sinuosum TaxID=1332059 RepID=A0AAE5AH71_9RICK|nr:ferrous iron transport protein B [Lyticum sinuosum]MDZ5761235.1 Ferrous iron transport protein B [Lyticum sinuosum]
MNNIIKVAIIGLVNVGKSSIFNNITSSKAATGNWHGVTISAEEKIVNNIKYIDLPGFHNINLFIKQITKNKSFNSNKKTNYINKNFINANNDISVDQILTFDYITNSDVDCIIHVTDIDHLRQSIILTKELKKIGKPLILIINKVDLAQRRGIVINTAKLSLIIQIPIILYSNNKKITELYWYGDIYHYKNIKNKFNTINNCLSSILFKYIFFCNILSAFDNYSQNSIFKTTNENNTLTWAVEVIDKTVTFHKANKERISDIIDNLLIRSFVGIPIFILAISLVLILSLYIGGIGQDICQYMIDNFLIYPSIKIISKFYINNHLISFISDGIGVAISTVVSFICPLFIIYFFTSFFEESGYMARVSLRANILMKKFGLPGKSLIPLMLGFGCNVTAIMGTRIITDNKQRFLVIAMIPFVTCSARLGVLVFFTRAFFSKFSFIVVISLYFIGILCSIITAIIFRKFIKNTVKNNIEEIPNYTFPSIFMIIKKSIFRTQSFVFNASKIIFPAAIIINLIVNYLVDENNKYININNCYNTQNETIIKNNIITINNNNSLDINYQSYQSKYEINKLNKKINKIVKIKKKSFCYGIPVYFWNNIGIECENWPAIVGLIAGTLAKETVVGVLYAMYGNLNKINQQKCLDLYKNDKTEILDITTDISNKNSQFYINKEIQKAFGNHSNAFAYIVFVMLYFPCISVFFAILREINLKVAIITSLWSTFLAYSISSLCKYINYIFII